MDQTTLRLMFALLSFAVCNKPLPEDIAELCTTQRMRDIFALATKHDIGNLVGEAFYASGLNRQLVESYDPFRKLQFEAISRYEKANYEFQRICNALEQAQIPHIPLKGAVLRMHYPAPWMRTSCDIDILVPADKVDLAADHLAEQLQYVKTDKNAHDIALWAKNGQHLELHYDLIEDSYSGSGARILRNVWEYTTLSKGTGYRYEMSDDMLYFYHIAHMAKHFETGGCGIRSFVDLWVLDRLPGADRQGRESLLEQGELLKFAHAATQLGQLWLDGIEPDGNLSYLQEYIITGGIYGSMENLVNVQSQKTGSKGGYLLSRLFLPYDVLKFQFPVLEKHKWLIPIMQVIRWFKIFDPKSRNKVRDEIKYSQNSTEATRMRMRRLLDTVGLDNKDVT